MSDELLRTVEEMLVEARANGLFAKRVRNKHAEWFVTYYVFGPNGRCLASGTDFVTAVRLALAEISPKFDPIYAGA